MSKTTVIDKCLKILKKADSYNDFNIFTNKTYNLALNQAEQSFLRYKTNSKYFKALIN